MMRLAILAGVLVVGCGYHLERDSPPPPPSETTATAAPTTAPVAPPTTTVAPAPTTVAPAPTTAPAEPSPPPSTHAAASSTCTAAYHCCQAAIEAMPIGGLVSCAHLREADASRDDECRQLITTYRGTLEQMGAAVPAACRAH